jgi:hypothetical protein
MVPEALSWREENEVHTAIAGELADMVEDGKVTHQEIRKRLRFLVNQVGIGHTDDYFVDIVKRSFTITKRV